MKRNTTIKEVLIMMTLSYTVAFILFVLLIITGIVVTLCMNEIDQLITDKRKEREERNRS